MHLSVTSDSFFQWVTLYLNYTLFAQIIPPDIVAPPPIYHLFKMY